MSQPLLFGEKFNPLNAWLEPRFEEVSAATFYRELWPKNSLAKRGEKVTGKYRGVAVRIKDGKPRRYSINDDLEILDNIQNSTSDEFWLASPVSYAGRTQKQSMARFLYAIAIDLDGIRIEDPMDPRGFGAMENQVRHGLYPRPTFIVSSGTGLHMYYMLERPIAMYRNVVAQLRKFRHDLIRRIWSSYITELWKRPQYESVTQGFRMVGTCTKAGDRVRAFRTGGKVTIEYLNQFTYEEKNRLTEFTYKTDLTLAEAREKYPDWYQRRIVEGRPRGSWTVSRNLYDWWRDKKLDAAENGHRYFYLMALAIYAMKCDISEEELHHDAWEVAKTLREKDKPGNPLTDDDVIKALGMYDASYQTFPRKTIESLTGIAMPPNKRNYRKQEVHLTIARFIRDLDRESDWWKGGNRDGAPTKQKIVRQWRENNPAGRKIDCERETGLSRHTVLKWWE